MATRITLKNYFLNSNFAKGLESWTNHLGAAITLSNGICTADGTDKGAIYITQNFSQTIKNHKVYASVKILKCRGQQTLYYEMPYTFFDVVYDVTKPTKMSGILTISNEMAYGGILNQTGSSMVIFTEPLMIDLTESFGVGKEPNKEWCDNNLKYFDGTTTIERPYEWTTPKTNWKQNDRFNSEVDYNRIKNNIGYLKGEYLKIYFPVKFYELSDDKYGYEGIPQYDEFNNIELTLDNIVRGTHTLDIGLVSLFYPDTPFVDWIELNRLEKGTVILYNGLKSQYENLKKLEFTLGGGDFE